MTVWVLFIEHQYGERYFTGFITSMGYARTAKEFERARWFENAAEAYEYAEKQAQNCVDLQHFRVGRRPRICTTKLMHYGRSLH